MRFNWQTSIDPFLGHLVPVTGLRLHLLAAQRAAGALAGGLAFAPHRPAVDEDMFDSRHTRLVVAVGGAAVPGKHAPDAYTIRHRFLGAKLSLACSSDIRTGPELAVPDVQYFFTHASYADPAVRELDRAPGMTLSVYQCRPESKGSVMFAIGGDGHDQSLSAH